MVSMPQWDVNKTKGPTRNVNENQGFRVANIWDTSQDLQDLQFSASDFRVILECCANQWLSKIISRQVAECRGENCDGLNAATGFYLLSRAVPWQWLLPLSRFLLSNDC